jgi:plastocyanin
MRATPLVIALIVAIFIGVGCMGSGGSLTGTTNGATNTTSGGGGTTVPVDMNGMLFTPQLVNAHAGDTVQWTNSGSLPHTVNSDTAQAALDSSGQFPSGITQGNSFSWQVPANAAIGTHYFYHCAFHGAAGNGSALGTGMTGEITVN